MGAFPWAAAGRGHSPSCVRFQPFLLAGVVPPKRHGYTCLAACKNKQCLLKHSKPGGAVCGEDAFHPGGDAPLQAQSQGDVRDVNAEASGRVLGMHRYSPQTGLMLCR